MDIPVTKEESNLLERIASVSSEINVSSYLIGGFVRDKLIARGCKDIDVVCIGNGIELAHAVAASLHPVPKVSYFKNFGTAHFNWKGFDVEFVGARRESYQSHSRKPEVTEGSLVDDQLRRDFTINALAIDLSKDNFG